MPQKSSIAIYAGAIPSTTFIERLIKGLANEGCEVQLFGPRLKKQAYGKSVRVLGYHNSKWRKGMFLLKYTLLLRLFRFKEKRRLDAFLKGLNKPLHLAKLLAYPVLWHRPDVFHIQWAKSLNQWIWVQEFGIKLVLSLRGAHINYSPIAYEELANMYRDHFPKVDRFHAVSKAIGKEAQIYGADPERIKVVYSGLKLSSSKLEVQTQSEQFQIISVGRTHWVKGYTYALDACLWLKEAGLSFKYTIVGGAGDIELQYQIYDLGLQDHVELLDPQPYDITQSLIQQMDLLLLPSLKEGIANVVLEAMALGTTVLTTNCGGMKEVVQDGVNGFMCPTRDAQTMARKILDIKALPENTILSIQNTARKTVESQHSEMNMIKGMRQLYDAVLEARGV